ncbi:cyclic 3',5'-adenosine monophosphate phosphodiesterase [Paenibacillus konkukensis]|uniref:Cyclic 3',5'-adenosine monophosphate phosphodiesterase n=1 Tax=Paenibacillus konkukensis TaxID=2020716 RepID=A0ABY4RR34_9BACL|nr:metallophosphoesterase [Paenibacillus konkukensis]UQZ83849.1 cyclic 3',5'-adenosine monophosphate phosphodiesterase [Paenibacillus konkukensis]
MRIALLGDFHYSRMDGGTAEMLEARDAAYKTMLDAFLQTEADLHISLGDLTHGGYPEEFRYVFEQINGSGRSFIHVLGNHDTYSIPKTEILAITGQQRYGAIELDEAKLLFLDSTKEMNRSDWGGELDERQLAWLKEQLEQSGGKPVLVFAHHPVYDTTAHSTKDKLSIHPDIDIQSALRAKQGPAFYFCGHNHINSIVSRDGWHYIQTAACLDHPAFRLIELSGKKLTIGFVTMEDETLSSHIERFNTQVKGFKPTADAQGLEQDRYLQVGL